MRLAFLKIFHFLRKQNNKKKTPAKTKNIKDLKDQWKDERDH